MTLTSSWTESAGATWQFSQTHTCAPADHAYFQLQGTTPPFVGGENIAGIIACSKCGSYTWVRWPERKENQS